jgi:hypothetical protein
MTVVFVFALVQRQSRRRRRRRRHRHLLKMILPKQFAVSVCLTAAGRLRLRTMILETFLLWLDFFIYILLIINYKIMLLQKEVVVKVVY